MIFLQCFMQKNVIRFGVMQGSGYGWIESIKRLTARMLLDATAYLGFRKLQKIDIKYQIST